jgi:hypothetical protein
VVGLGPPAENVGEVPRPGAVIDLDKRAAGRRLSQDAEGPVAKDELVPAVAVVIEGLPALRIGRRLFRIEQMTIGGLPKMGQVEPAEYAVPVGVVALALIEVPAAGGSLEERTSPETMIIRLWRWFASGYLRQKSRKKPPRTNRRSSGATAALSFSYAARPSGSRTHSIISS